MAVIMEDGRIRVCILALRMENYVDSVCQSIYKNYSH
jgi:hypothetical protein